MYEQFFGLNERPFDLTPNPKYLFLTPSHREALSNLKYGISAAHRRHRADRRSRHREDDADPRDAGIARRARRPSAIYLNNPTLTRTEFLEFLAREFQPAPHGRGIARPVCWSELEQSLLRAHGRAGVTPALIIDEAQSLPHELLEEIRLLANIETTTEKLLPIVLAGQPELADRLNHTSLRQLKQRVGLRCQLKPLDLRETAAYITARIGVAGGTASTLFTTGRGDSRFTSEPGDPAHDQRHLP